MPVVLIISCLLLSQAEVAEKPDPLYIQPFQTATAIFPGLIIPGSGHFSSGYREESMDLLVFGGSGLGILALGGIPTIVSHASRRFNTVTIPLIIAGAGTWLISWYADIFGTTAKGAWAGSEPENSPFQLEGGFAYTKNPLFEFSTFARIAGSAQWSVFSGMLEMWHALDDSNTRVTAQGRVRLLNRKKDEKEFYSVYLGGEYWFHRFGTEDFTNKGAAIFLQSRMNLGELVKTASGSFASVTVGLGASTTDYGIKGNTDEIETLVTSGFSMGLYLGKGRGEVELYYNHRHDDFAGGLKLGISGDGIVGYFGVRGFYKVFEGWAVKWDVAMGSNPVIFLGVARR